MKKKLTLETSSGATCIPTSSGARTSTSFEQREFGVVRKLCALLEIDNELTQAVACHDIGEFAVLHPLGKKKVADFAVKEHVMKLMESESREVRREALLCCQKI